MNEESLLRLARAECSEKDKYDHLWRTIYMPSQCSIFLAEYIHKLSGPDQSLLEIGCGNGGVVRQLNLKGHVCVGLDITLAGIKGDRSGFVEASVWRMPFQDNQFDFTFSSDVLEHLPTDLVEPAIKEICRVTRHKTFHCIANFPDSPEGIELHLTQQPMEWWRAKFNKHTMKFGFCFSRQIATIIIDRKDFLKEVGYGA